MENNDLNVSSRRGFLGTLATGAAALGITTLASPLSMMASPDFSQQGIADAEEWFNKIKGKHRIVFDAPRPHEIFPFAWPRVFLLTNGATGTPEKDCSVVVILRHDAIPYAMQHDLWAKYNFGEVFKADDPATKQPATRNPFWKPEQGAFKVPGFGVINIGINELQESGVMFCVCDAAMTVYSAAIAGKMNLDPAVVKKEWVAGLLPNIQPMPSGVWAVNRAQEHGCSYCFAG
ncbi:twin-arginine translocation signal domain-containing protein [Paraflavitalea sp. CAU 1676]|uniref:twin-arginine translocation signal domain-containing protein n=1 Tax=Paraflavitalea sp. CAU 1676 TaxID=3032598 RepID=UPI0023D9CE73|nr:twin-arginine translocation signal domain-containing protein [Paraflavitalea sp. CAU 1676]MDF2190866.1 twin-arginine translocation signal domain-containing protein [Paraflavitalea sp. CAU 1676]